MNPKVTVLMPVYNGERFLRDAIGSILNQTFTDYEFLIINDGSTDRSVDIIKSYSDKRIKLIENDKNRGLIATLNKGIELARGEYLARMDCDDISLPERFAVQVDFMDNHPAIAVCGAWCKLIGIHEGDIWRYPSDPDKIRCMLLFESVLVHPSVMMRRELMSSQGLFYSPSFPHAEDYELWVRTSRTCQLANIEKILLLYRTHPDQVGTRHSRVKYKSADSIYKLFLNELGITPTGEEMELHIAISRWQYPGNRRFVEMAEDWLRKLRKVNRLKAVLPERAFSSVISEKWLATCEGNLELGGWILMKYLRSSLRDGSVPVRREIRFMGSYLFKTCSPIRKIFQFGS